MVNLGVYTKNRKNVDSCEGKIEKKDTGCFEKIVSHTFPSMTATNLSDKGNCNDRKRSKRFKAKMFTALDFVI